MSKLRHTFWDQLFMKENAKKLSNVLQNPISHPLKLSASDASLLPVLPKNSQMSAKDFIHNSLYHPRYGYFSSQAKVFKPTSPIPLNLLKNNDEFFTVLSLLYKDIEREGSVQLWHTPTEIFQPFYGMALAKNIVETFRMNPSPSLDIYEIGAGNGTLMRNIMEYLRDMEPELLNLTTYTIIEISESLVKRQRDTVDDLSSVLKTKVKIINKSILEWDQIKSSPCFFIALEVLVNLLR